MSAANVFRRISYRVAEAPGRSDRIIVSIDVPIDLADDTFATPENPGNFRPVVLCQHEWKGGCDSALDESWLLGRFPPKTCSTKEALPSTTKRLTLEDE